jgi:hypothetical protein
MQTKFNKSKRPKKRDVNLVVTSALQRAFCALAQFDEPWRLQGMTSDCVRARCREYPGHTVQESYCAYLETLGNLLFGISRATFKRTFLMIHHIPCPEETELNGKCLPEKLLEICGGTTAYFNSYADHLEQSIADRLTALVPAARYSTGVVNGVLNLAPELLVQLNSELDTAREFRASWLSTSPTPNRNDYSDKHSVPRARGSRYLQ